MKNIFCCSNAHKELFPHNTRSSFDSYIDIHDLDYLEGDDIEAAIKSIAFDNKQSIELIPNINKPHFIIIQPIRDENKFLQFLNVNLGKNVEITGEEKAE